MLFKEEKNLQFFQRNPSFRMKSQHTLLKHCCLCQSELVRQLIALQCSDYYSLPSIHFSYLISPIEPKISVISEYSSLYEQPKGCTAI